MGIDEREPDPPDDVAALRIMTIHGAKGLDGRIVIVADTTDPPSRFDGGIWPVPELGAIPVKLGNNDAPWKDSVKGIEGRELAQEAVRLIYVALTRARDHLVLVHIPHPGLCESWLTVIENAASAQQIIPSLTRVAVPVPAERPAGPMRLLIAD
jgi:hypothetical protein